MAYSQLQILYFQAVLRGHTLVVEKCAWPGFRSETGCRQFSQQNAAWHYFRSYKHPLAFARWPNNRHLQQIGVFPNASRIAGLAKIA